MGLGVLIQTAVVVVAVAFGHPHFHGAGDGKALWGVKEEKAGSEAVGHQVAVLDVAHEMYVPTCGGSQSRFGGGFTGYDGQGSTGLKRLGRIVRTNNFSIDNIPSDIALWINWRRSIEGLIENKMNPANYGWASSVVSKPIRNGVISYFVSISGNSVRDNLQHKKWSFERREGAFGDIGPSMRCIGDAFHRKRSLGCGVRTLFGNIYAVSSLCSQPLFQDVLAPRQPNQERRKGDDDPIRPGAQLYAALGLLGLSCVWLGWRLGRELWLGRLMEGASCGLWVAGCLLLFWSFLHLLG